MTRVRNIHPAALLPLLLAQPATGQNALDLDEADVRNEAYEIMAAAETQFDCKLEERSMRTVGNDPDVLYVFYVGAEGNECRAALVLASNVAARSGRLVFRQVQGEDDESDVPPGAGDRFMEEALINSQQLLIHEIDPGVDAETATPAPDE